MHWGTSKIVPFFKLDLSLPKYMGCQSYKPLISTAIKGTFYWKVKVPYLALLKYMRAVVGSAHLSAKSKSKLQQTKTWNIPEEPWGFLCQHSSPCLHINMWQMHWQGRRFVKQLPQSLSYSRQSLLPDTYCFNINNEDESLKQLWSISEQVLRQIYVCLLWRCMLWHLREHCPGVFFALSSLSPQHLSQILKFHPCSKEKGILTFHFPPAPCLF